MKCKKCGQTMNRVKVSENHYEYQCPKCGNVVGRKKSESIEKPEDK